MAIDTAPVASLGVTDLKPAGMPAPTEISSLPVFGSEQAAYVPKFKSANVAKALRPMIIKPVAKAA